MCYLSSVTDKIMRTGPPSAARRAVLSGLALLASRGSLVLPQRAALAFDNRLPQDELCVACQPRPLTCCPVC